MKFSVKYLNLYLSLLVITLLGACHEEDVLLSEEAKAREEITGDPIRFTTNLEALSSSKLATRYGVLDDTVINSTSGGTLRIWAYEHAAGMDNEADLRDVEPYIYDIDNALPAYNNFYPGIKLEMEGYTAPYSYFQGNRQYSWPVSAYALDFYAVYSTHPNFIGPKSFMFGSYQIRSGNTFIPQFLTGICDSSDVRVTKQADILMAEPVLNKINQGTNEPIKFVFSHALAQIRVKFMDIEKEDATLSNVRLLPTTTPIYLSMLYNWDGTGIKTNWVYGKKGPWNLVTPQGDAILRGDNADDYFCTLMVPQTLKNVTLKALYTNETGVHEISLNLNNEKYESGKRYTYYLYRTSDYILFTPPDVTPWEVEQKEDINF